MGGAVARDIGALGFEMAGEDVAAMAGGDEIERVDGCWMKHCMERGEAGGAYRTWRQSIVFIGIIGIVAVEVCPGDRVIEGGGAALGGGENDRRVGLQFHPALEPIFIDRGDFGEFGA